MRFPGRDDHASQRQGANIQFVQGLHKGLGRWIRQDLFFLRGRAVKQRSVFGDDPFKQVEVWKNPHQIGKLAAGHHDQAATRREESLQTVNGRIIDLSMMRERTVVISCQDVVSH
jgi:hypothetical protein